MPDKQKAKPALSHTRYQINSKYAFSECMQYSAQVVKLLNDGYLVLFLGLNAKRKYCGTASSWLVGWLVGWLIGRTYTSNNTQVVVIVAAVVSSFCIHVTQEGVTAGAVTMASAAYSFMP
ncbi:hypothetical protein GQX74_004275 [Glossina fuscipes]|uniref:Uncharacterized protein n=1 Tax=Glossina palpalis gambiensis TaxID=67801 RepID=A0A1B0B878_9MUSC|nr:hypothetical protein GQX74_004275 [Glossina fuscipes]